MMDVIQPVGFSRFSLVRKSSLSVVIALCLLCACPAGQHSSSEKSSPVSASASDSQLLVVCTTSLLTDATKSIGGTKIRVSGLMGPGVDPHLYQARPSDMDLLAAADLIIYHGLHLEAKLADVLAAMGKSRPVLAAAEAALPAELLITAGGESGSPDPHVWFDVELWMRVCERIGRELALLDPENAQSYKESTAAYLLQLEDVHEYVSREAERVPDHLRYLITAHDAFGYFGHKYSFTVMGLQGISTEAEAGTGDVRQLTDFIVSHKLPAIFVESSVPVRSIEALVAAAAARGHKLVIGGELYSDALGAADGPAGNYPGMVRHNIDTIVRALR
jgi:manganese/zinc/iron transport system substrate-binding protein